MVQQVGVNVAARLGQTPGLDIFLLVAVNLGQKSRRKEFVAMLGVDKAGIDTVKLHS